MDCNQIVFYILTGCTHNCRLCVSGVPYYRAARRSYMVSLPDFRAEADAVFRLFSRVERITVTGGEPLLHPKLAELLTYLMHYASQFGECRVFTNGSLMPDEALIGLINGSGGKLSFVVNDYGAALSPCAAEIQKKTGCRVNRYTGAGQYFDGWVDYGPLDRRRPYGEAEALDVIRRCHFTDWKMYNIFRGKLYYCTRAAAGADLGFFTLDARDFLDLNDPSLSLEEQREKILRLGTFPTEACYYCDSFDTKNSTRYPAAEQMKEDGGHD